MALAVMTMQLVSLLCLADVHLMTWFEGGYYEGEFWALQRTGVQVKAKLRSRQTKRDPFLGLEGFVQPDGKTVCYPKADGLRHGKGIRVWVSGSKYEGEWAADHMHGFGVMEEAGDCGYMYVL